MPIRRSTHVLAAVPPDEPAAKVTIAGLVSKLLADGPARSDAEVFAYIETHLDWEAIASRDSLIAQAKWAYIEKALHGTMTMTVNTVDGQTKKKRVRKYLKPTEYDADGNAEGRWKLAQRCTEKQLKECSTGYVKQTLDLAEATNAFGIYAKQIVKHRQALHQASQAALPAARTRKQAEKFIRAPRDQIFFTEFLEVEAVNPDTGERRLRVKVEDIQIEAFASEPL